MGSDFGFLIKVFSFILMTGLTSSTPPKSVNLAVETSFLFEPQDIQEKTILNNVRRFLDKLDQILRPESAPVFRVENKDKEEENIKDKEEEIIKDKEEEIIKDKEEHTQEGDISKDHIPVKYTLTKFMAELGKTLINYDDENVKRVTRVLNEQLKKQYVHNKLFHDIFNDITLKKFIKSSAKEWAETEPMKLKVEIAKNVINYAVTPVEIFFRKLDAIYSEEDGLKFKKLLNEFAHAKNDEDFENAVAKAVKFLIYDRYEKAGYVAKVLLQHELKTLTDYVSKFYKYRLNRVEMEDSLSKNEDETYKKHSINIENYKNMNIVEKDAQVSMNHGKQSNEENNLTGK